jgi:hypothetical protein
VKQYFPSSLTNTEAIGGSKRIVSVCLLKVAYRQNLSRFVSIACCNLTCLAAWLRRCFYYVVNVPVTESGVHIA